MPASPQPRRNSNEMACLAAEGIRAGALGFSTSRTLNHKTLSGESIPTLAAAEDELATIATAIGETGTGWLQVIADFDEQLPAEFAMLRRLAAASGRPMTMTVLERDTKPEEWRHLLDGIAAANADGIAMTGQVLTRPTGILLGFEISQHPFVDCPAYQPVAGLPFAQRLAALRDPEMRRRLLAEATARMSLCASRAQLGSYLPAWRSTGLRAGCRAEHGGGGAPPRPRSGGAHL